VESIHDKNNFKKYFLFILFYILYKMTTEETKIIDDAEPSTQEETSPSRRRGRPAKYSDNSERMKAMLDQKKTYIDSNKDKLKEKRQLRAMLNNVPILQQKLINANKAIYKLVKDEELAEETLTLNETIYREAQKILHPLKC
jgi:hypothetical protein